VTPQNLFKVRTELLVLSKQLIGSLVPGHARQGERFNFSSDHYALEAWERMTTGGLKVPCLSGYLNAHAVESPVFQWVLDGSIHAEWR